MRWRARAQGKKVVFVTNNSTKSRAGYLGKFTSLGLNVAAEEIYSSSYAAAAYLESINFPKTKKARRRAVRGPQRASCSAEQCSDMCRASRRWVHIKGAAG